MIKRRLTNKKLDNQLNTRENTDVIQYEIGKINNIRLSIMMLCICKVDSILSLNLTLKYKVIYE